MFLLILLGLLRSLILISLSLFSLFLVLTRKPTFCLFPFCSPTHIPLCACSSWSPLPAPFNDTSDLIEQNERNHLLFDFSFSYFSFATISFRCSTQNFFYHVWSCIFIYYLCSNSITNIRVNIGKIRKNLLISFIMIFLTIMGEHLSIFLSYKHHI